MMRLLAAIFCCRDFCGELQAKLQCTMARILLLSLSMLLLSGCIGPGLQSDGSAMPKVQDSRAVLDAFAAAKQAEQQGNDTLAQQHYEEMLSRGARSSRALNHYAVFLRRQFDIDAAEAIYRRALKYSPQDAATHYNLGILYELYRGDFARAAEHYRAYQGYSAEPQPQVAGWIADLERRAKAEAGS